MAVKLDIDGFEEIYAKLKELGASAEGKVNVALEKAIQPIHQEVERTAPYDRKGHRSKRGEGHLKDSVPVNKVEKNGTLHYISVGWKKGDNSPHFYAKFLEWGTSKMKAQPFMQPAYKKRKNKAFETFANEIKKGLGL